MPLWNFDDLSRGAKLYPSLIGGDTSRSEQAPVAKECSFRSPEAEVAACEALDRRLCIMNSEQAAARGRVSRWRRISLITPAVLLLLVAGGFALLLHDWPFRQKDILETLQETVPGTKVTVARFHSTYFMHPGAVAEGLVFTRQNSQPGNPPLVTVQKITIQANYHDFLYRPGYISRIVVDGLHIQVPARGTGTGSAAGSGSFTAITRTSVGEIVSSGALLEIARRDSDPLKFKIHSIRVSSVAAGKPMSYTVNLQNPLPPGEIHASGRLGPWSASDIGQLPVSGDYKFDQANLGVFDGIQGTLSSTGHFQGRLGQIGVDGNTSIPDFALKSAGHTVNLKSRFQAEVNGTDGDVKLSQVAVQLNDTPIAVHGLIRGEAAAKGKLTTLDLSSAKGQVQDILRPFVSATSPPMLGPIIFRAHVVFPSGERPFFKRVRLVGDFNIAHGRFGSPQTQSSVDNLSERSRGIKNGQGNSDRVEAGLSSDVTLANGVAKFSNLAMTVPGATARMNGTFNVINEKIDFHGALKTDVKLSDTTKGIKSVLLKPFDPIFKRKRHEGASIPVEMTGTYSQPHFGMEVIPK